jgi:hypothetical protein
MYYWEDVHEIYFDDENINKKKDFCLDKYPSYVFIFITSIIMTSNLLYTYM